MSLIHLCELVSSILPQVNFYPEPDGLISLFANFYLIITNGERQRTRVLRVLSNTRTTIFVNGLHHVISGA
jgi:hypothetical protein